MGIRNEYAWIVCDMKENCRANTVTACMHVEFHYIHVAKCRLRVSFHYALLMNTHLFIVASSELRESANLEATVIAFFLPLTPPALSSSIRSSCDMNYTTKTRAAQK